MRLGISTSLYGLSPKEWADKLVSLGCKSAVFPVDYTADPELIDEYVAEADSHDILIAEVGVWRNAISEIKHEADANMDYTIEQLRLADRIGARCCVNVAGAIKGERWDGGYRDNFSKYAWDKTVSMIQEVIDTVNPTNTYFSIESMPWMIPTGPEEYMKLIEAVDRDRFAAHLDIINMINCPQRYFFSEEFTKECFDILGPYIVSCHLKDIQLLEDYTFQLRECACGEGSFNFTNYMKMASNLDPDMPMIIEHLADDYAYEESVAYVLDKFKTGR